MSVIKNFTDLTAWQEGHKIVLLIYKQTKKFPSEEKFGLTNQIRRAAVSITSNIAEGFARKTLKEKIQFYNIARGSLAEVQNQLLIAKDIQYISKEKYKISYDISISIYRLLNALIKKTQELSSKTSSFQ